MPDAGVSTQIARMANPDESFPPPGEPNSVDQRAESTALLRAVCNGGKEAEEQLVPILYSQLRQVADSLMASERDGHTLQATELVHEAWLRLVDVDGLGATNGGDARHHFLALAARTMRRVLIDHARRRSADKRGGGQLQRVVFHDAFAIMSVDDHLLLDLEASLSRLAKEDENAAAVAELKLFGGLTFAEIAPIRKTSATEAKRDWAFARALLTKYLAAC